MVVRCKPEGDQVGCGRLYDDAAQWTICPHGPLWAAPDAYCPEHDLVNCHMHKEAGPEPRGGLQDG